MTSLEVPGARLYYESAGKGPPLVMIPGANGDADVFKPVGEPLARHYTVITYDRRGFSRSRLLGPQDYRCRLETDADDVRRLIEHLSDEPATVFGASSGALVAFEVLIRHPWVVDTLVAFEPPAVKQLPDGQIWIDFFSGVYTLWHQSGPGPALERFRGEAFAEADRMVMARARESGKGPQAAANAAYWFEHELRQYPAVELDLGGLRPHSERIVLAVGRDSVGYPCHRVNAALAERLGRDLVELPGGHVGFVAHPDEFARELLAALSPRHARHDH